MVNFITFNLYSVVDGHDVSINENFYNRVEINANGIVVWSPFFNWVTSCDIDAFYFPFDNHRCRVEFMNWIYKVNLVNFTITPNASVDTSLLKKSADWLIISTSVGTAVR